MDALTALAEPTRRRIADELRLRECSVSDLVTALRMSQPAISKHLRVLREAGVVSARVSAQQRIYRLEPGPFRELDAWLAPYRQMWTRHLAALERHLDYQTQEQDLQTPGHHPQAQQRHPDSQTQEHHHP